jgi:GNAT superfamily N-acetyltransferase
MRESTLNSQRAPASIVIVPATTDEHWRHVGALIAELKEWDVAECQVLGFDRKEVERAFYPNDLATIRRESAPLDGSLLLAMDEERAAGCAAFHRLRDQACELSHVYLRPSHRGQGVAALLLRRVMSNATSAGYKSMFLETATFMRSAHVLYKAHGFKVREPYRQLPARFDAVTISMEAALRD